MPARKPPRLKYRPLLSETLPYEVPIIFSNSQMYSTACESISDVGLKRGLDLTIRQSSSWTIPYEYKITKGRSATRSLAVMHPLVQLTACDFYERYERTVLDACSKSSFSLRYPADVSNIYLKAAGAEASWTAEDDSTDLEDTAEMDAPMVGSYFAYAKYTNMGRYMDSAEFVRLEKRFAKLIKLDISRCFPSIYTHSVAWAVKGRWLSKRHAQKHSFEGSFDRLMMNANCNETNGILVGPEISRVFAEIILQEVDKNVASELNQLNLKEGWDYAVRRYVDDYHIFVSDERLAADIVQRLSKHLAIYKMHTNEDKYGSSDRPFISDISVARKEIKDQFRRIGVGLSAVKVGSDAIEARKAARAIRADIEELRIIAQRNRVEFSAISGWVLGFVKQTLRRLWERFKDEAQPDCEAGIAEIVASLIRLTFYVCALDFRVRPTYSLAEIVVEALRLEGLLSEGCVDVIRHALNEEFFSLVRANASFGSALSDRDDPIEIFNILICGSHFLGASFIRSSDVADAIRKMAHGGNLTYFRYISAKFCMLKAPDVFDADLLILNEATKDYLTSDAVRIERDTMSFLLFADYLSAPDVNVTDKRAVYLAKTGANISGQVMRLLGPRLRYADWTGRSIKALLDRKELRPVYE